MSTSVTKQWQRYPVYKASGVQWLGEVPESWKVRRLKFLLIEPLKYGANESAEFDDKDCPRFIRITDIAEDGSLREDTFRSLPEDIAKPFILKTGDILFARSGATVGKTFMYKTHWGRACHAGYLIRARLKLSEAIPEFVSYFANSSVYWDWIGSIFIQATIQNISAEKYANLYLCVPPLPEQKAIAQFLDQQTAKIDTLIDKKERSIELLKEKRAALISYAVTKGLDPDVPMKDSGVQWLGEIPAHWKVKRLKYIFQVVNGSTPKSGISEYWDGDIFWITPDDLGKLKTNKIFTTERQITTAGYHGCGTKLVPVGSLVLSTRAPIGHLGIAGVELCSNQGCRCLVFRHKQSEQFFYYLLLAAQKELELWGQGTTFQELAKGKLEAIFLSLPPLPEQKAIAQFLDEQTAKIDTLIAKTRTSIDKLKEYRTALISAAVTGKIKVVDEL